VTTHRRVGLLLALSYVGFVSLGLPDGLLGVAWPSIRARFGLELDALGPLLVATTAGYVFASFSSGRVLARMNLGALLAASCAATATSLLGYAFAPAWFVLVGFGLFAGLGAGAIDAALNTYVATNHSPRTLNWLHACYGVGAASGPALMTGVLMAGHPWQRGYGLVALGQIALALCFTATRPIWPPVAGETHAASPTGAASSRVTLAQPAAWLGMAAFFLYVGLEQSAGAWAYSFLTEVRGVSLAAAGTWVTLYWSGLTAGRVIFGLVANRWPLEALVRGALVAIAAAAALIAADPFPAASALGLALLGFACGPIFPSLIAATPARLGVAHAANGVGFQIAAAACGQALIPWAVGGLAQRSSLAVLGPVLLGFAVALIAVHEVLARSGSVSAIGATEAT
jgi:fucose permease